MQEIDKLIYENKGLVYAQLNKFYLVDDPEAESIAYEALYNAILNYDSTRGNKLSTVATVYIYNALGTYVRSLNNKRQITVVSYNDTAYTDDSGEHEFLELLSTGSSPEERYIKNEMRKRVRRVFKETYDMLTNDKHKAILSIWKESEYSATTMDISKQVGVSQSYVSQVINNFKHSLRKKLEDVYYD